MNKHNDEIVERLLRRVSYLLDHFLCDYWRPDEDCNECKLLCHILEYADNAAAAAATANSDGETDRHSTRRTDNVSFGVGCHEIPLSTLPRQDKESGTKGGGTAETKVKTESVH